MIISFQKLFIFIFIFYLCLQSSQTAPSIPYPAQSQLVSLEPRLEAELRPLALPMLQQIQPSNHRRQYLKNLAQEPLQVREPAALQAQASGRQQ
jgi:hypothetical protein